MMEKTKIIETLQDEIKNCEAYLKNEPEEVMGYDEICITIQTRKEACEWFLEMIEGS